MANRPKMSLGQTCLYVLLKLWVWILIGAFAVVVTGGLILVVLVPVLVLVVLAVFL